MKDKFSIDTINISTLLFAVVASLSISNLRSIIGIAIFATTILLALSFTFKKIGKTAIYALVLTVLKSIKLIVSLQFVIATFSVFSIFSIAYGVLEVLFYFVLFRIYQKDTEPKQLFKGMFGISIGLAVCVILGNAQYAPGSMVGAIISAFSKALYLIPLMLFCYPAFRKPVKEKKSVLINISALVVIGVIIFGLVSLLSSTASSDQLDSSTCPVCHKAYTDSANRQSIAYSNVCKRCNKNIDFQQEAQDWIDTLPK